MSYADEVIKRSFGGEPIMYTDNDGNKHPGNVHDRMPGKGGYIGITYMKHGIETFEFVEMDQVEWL